MSAASSKTGERALFTGLMAGRLSSALPGSSPGMFLTSEACERAALPNLRNMLISIIIPTCNRNDLLAQCLDCLAPGKQKGGKIEGATSDSRSITASFTYEVIVTDDSSKSSAQEIIARDYPWVRWVAGPRRGPAANRNNGAKHARGEWLVFTDDDCLPNSEFLSAYWNAAVGNGALVLEGKTSPSGIRTRVDMECPANESGGNLWSCNMAIRKFLFFELEGFDCNFPGPAMEDTDLHVRLLKAGKVIKFVPEALVLHPWRQSRGISFCKLHSKSRGYFVAKHPETAGTVSLKSLSIDLARRLFKQLPPIALECKGRGLGREVLLSFYTFYASIAYSKKSNGSRPHGKAEAQT